MGTEAGSVEGVDDLRRDFEEFSPRLIVALTKHIERFVIGLQSHIRENYLSGSPLHQRSGNLKRSLNYAPVVATEHEVSSGVGDNMEYAPVHELGLTVTIPEHERTMSMVYGRPVDPRKILVAEHKASFPERPFLMPGLADKADEFYEEMDAAADEATKATS